MVVETEDKDVRHPEGKILLMNGNVLDCFEKDEKPAVIVPDALGLDTTGEFLQLRKGPKRKAGKTNKEPWEELFLKEAFFLYAHREQIYSDSRMFLTPVSFRNNLAYSGTSGLKDATLGVYLEWWDSCPRSVIRSGEEIVALTYFIAGSPLSGSNKCSVVDRAGKSRGHVFTSPFMEIWSSFMKVNGRYTEAKQIYQAYTLEETLEKLRGA